MNKRLWLFTLISLTLLGMATPVTAKPIGPQKSKNPHLEGTPEGVEVLLPSGGFHSWMADTEFWYIDFEHGLDAARAKGLARRAAAIALADIMEVMTDAEAALAAEHTWFYISYEVLVEMMMALGGLTPEEAEAMTAVWPDGVYVRFVNVGH